MEEIKVINLGEKDSLVMIQKFNMKMKKYFNK